MKEIFVHYDAINKMTKEELYLLLQTTRAINATKQFNKILIDKYDTRTKNNVAAVDYFEYICYQGSLLWEIIDVLRKDLAKRYIKYLDATLNNRINEILVKEKSQDDIRLKIIQDIRNKHSFHIAHDDKYAFSSIDDKPTRSDFRIGYAESLEEIDIIYTIENGVLISYLKKKYMLSEADTYDKIITAVNEYSEILFDLFNDIFKKIMSDKIYVL